MNKRTQTRPARKKAAQQNDATRWRTYALMLGCGLMLLTGFFFAGRQHFLSMDYGMKNSRLRKQVDDLETEKRRLLLAREVSLSPNEIKKALSKSGMTDPAAAPVEGEVAQVAVATREKALPKTAAEVKPMVIKTVSVNPVVTRVAAVYSKPEKFDKQGRKTLSAE